MISKSACLISSVIINSLWNHVSKFVMENKEGPTCVGYMEVREIGAS